MFVIIFRKKRPEDSNASLRSPVPRDSTDAGKDKKSKKKTKSSKYAKSSKVSSKKAYYDVAPQAVAEPKIESSQTQQSESSPLYHQDQATESTQSAVSPNTTIQSDILPIETSTPLYYSQEYKISPVAIKKLNGSPFPVKKLKNSPKPIKQSKLSDVPSQNKSSPHTASASRFSPNQSESPKSRSIFFTESSPYTFTSSESNVSPNITHETNVSPNITRETKISQNAGGKPDEEYLSYSTKEIKSSFFVTEKFENVFKSSKNSKMPAYSSSDYKKTSNGTMSSAAASDIRIQSKNVPTSKKETNASPKIIQHKIEISPEPSKESKSSKLKTSDF